MSPLSQFKEWILRRNPLLKNAFTLGANAVIGQSITLLSVPVLSYLYTPDSFGKAGLLLTYMGIVYPVLTLRLDMALVGSDNEEARHLLFMGIPIVVTMALLLAGCFSSLCFFGIGHYGELPMWAPLLVFGGLSVSGVMSLLWGWGLREGAFRQLASVYLVQGGLRSGIQILTGLLNIQWVGLVLGEIVGTLGRVRVLWRMAAPIIKEVKACFTWRDTMGILWRHHQYPLIAAPSGLLDTLHGNLTFPLLAYTYGSSVAGHYFLAERLLALPAMMISGAFAYSFHYRIAQVFREERSLAESVVRSALKQIGMFSVLVFGIMGVFLGIGWRWVFAAEWGLAHQIAWLLLPAIWIQFVVSPLSRVFTLPGYLKPKLIFDILGVARILTVFGTAIHWQLSPVGWQATSTGLALLLYTVYLMLIYRTARRIARSASSDSGRGYTS